MSALTSTVQDLAVESSEISHDRAGEKRKNYEISEGNQLTNSEKGMKASEIKKVKLNNNDEALMEGHPDSFDRGLCVCEPADKHSRDFLSSNIISSTSVIVVSSSDTTAASIVGSLSNSVISTATTNNNGICLVEAEKICSEQTEDNVLQAASSGSVLPKATAAEALVEHDTLQSSDALSSLPQLAQEDTSKSHSIDSSVHNGHTMTNNANIVGFPLSLALIPTGAISVASDLSNVPAWLPSPALQYVRIPSNSAGRVVSLSRVPVSSVYLPMLSFPVGFRPAVQTTAVNIPVLAENHKFKLPNPVNLLNTQLPSYLSANTIPTSRRNETGHANVLSAIPRPLLSPSTSIFVNHSSNASVPNGISTNSNERTICIPATVTDVNNLEKNKSSSNEIIFPTACTSRAPTSDSSVKRISVSLTRVFEKLGESLQSRNEGSRPNIVLPKSVEEVGSINSTANIEALIAASQCPVGFSPQQQYHHNNNSNDVNEQQNNQLNDFTADSLQNKYNPLVKFSLAPNSYILPNITNNNGCHLTHTNIASACASIRSVSAYATSNTTVLDTSHVSAELILNQKNLRSTATIISDNKAIMSQCVLKSGVLEAVPERVRCSLEDKSSKDEIEYSGKRFRPTMIDLLEATKCKPENSKSFGTLEQLRPYMQTGNTITKLPANHIKIPSSSSTYNIPEENIKAKNHKKPRVTKRLKNGLATLKDASSDRHVRMGNVRSESKTEGRLLLKDWLIKQVELKYIPGLDWVDPSKRTLLKIPWIHGSKSGWIPECHALLFKHWAIHSGKYSPDRDEPNPKKWKANFRCALNSLHDVQEATDLSRKNGTNGYKVYRISGGETLNEINVTSKEVTKSVTKPTQGRKSRVKLNQSTKEAVTESVVCDDGIIYEAISPYNEHNAEDDDQSSKYPVFVTNGNSVSSSRSSSRTSSLGSDCKTEVDSPTRNYIKSEPDIDYSKIPAPAADLAMESKSRKYSIRSSRETNEAKNKFSRNLELISQASRNFNGVLKVQNEHITTHDNLSSKENRPALKVETLTPGFDSGTAVYEEVAITSSNEIKPVPAGACLHMLHTIKEIPSYNKPSKKERNSSDTQMSHVTVYRNDDATDTDDDTEGTDDDDNDDDDSPDDNVADDTLVTGKHNDEATLKEPVYAVLENMEIAHSEEVTEEFSVQVMQELQTSLEYGQVKLANINPIQGVVHSRCEDLIVKSDCYHADVIPTCVKDLEGDDDDDDDNKREQQLQRL